MWATSVVTDRFADRSNTWFGTGLLCGFGTTLLLVHAIHFYTDLHESLAVLVVGCLLPAGVVGTVVAGTVWLWYGDFPRRYISHVAGWTVVGGLVLLLAVGALGFTGVIDIPGLTPQGPPSVADVPGSNDTVAGLAMEDIETSVVEAMAAATGDAPTAFAPLYESLDPDALDELVRSAAERSGEDALVVSFTHAGCEVTVRSDGSVLARPAEES